MIFVAILALGNWPLFTAEARATVGPGRADGHASNIKTSAGKAFVAGWAVTAALQVGLLEIIQRRKTGAIGLDPEHRAVARTAAVKRRPIQGAAR